MLALALLWPVLVENTPTNSQLRARIVPPTTTRLEDKRAAHPYHLVFTSLKAVLSTQV